MEGAVKGRPVFIEIDLRDRRLSKRKPKTSVAGRNSGSVVCLVTKAGLSEEWQGSTVIEDMAVRVSR